VDREELNSRLSRISTQWTMVFQAHGGEAPAVSAAQKVLLQRYCGAIYRYLLGALRDPDAADELSQEFALRFCRGDFRRADPGKGRFRDFVKTSLYHLIVDHQNRRRKAPRSLASDAPEPADSEPDFSHLDQDFLTRWREEVMNRAWEALAQLEERTGQPYYTALQFRKDHPELSSAQMAEGLGARLGKAMSAANVRQIVHRAREKFADLLVEEVGRSLETKDPDCLEQELIDLGLLSYCQSALGRQDAP
jgi:RNA polymerase sigma-70 factor (ECF subfamily)